MTAKRTKSKGSSKGQSFKSANKLSFKTLLGFALVFAVLSSYLVYSGWADSGWRGYQKRFGTPSLYVEPDRQNVSNGSTVSVEVWAETRNQPVNAVQANLAYPTDKFQFLSVNSSGSAFGIEAQGEASGGTVLIARGNFEPVKGKVLVATVNFKMLETGRAQVSFTTGSAVVNSDTNKDILDRTYRGTYYIRN